MNPAQVAYTALLVITLPVSTSHSRDPNHEPIPEGPPPSPNADARILDDRDDELPDQQEPFDPFFDDNQEMLMNTFRSVLAGQAELDTIITLLRILAPPALVLH